MRLDKMQAAKLKAGNYCAYQERTQQEVRDKLYGIGLYSDEVEQVLAELITENYINEERFAKSFAGGKFRLKQWGKKKIVYALKQRNISPYCIEQALKEISDEEYERVITQLVERKSNQLQGDIFIVKNKITRYLVGKGFENELVWSIVNKQLDSGG